MTRQKVRNTDSRINRDKLIAALGTLLFAGVLLLVLFLTSVGQERAELAQSATPEIMPEEEMFFEPELIDLGEDESKTVDEAAPSNQGEPEKSEVVETQTIVKGENPKPAPTKQKEVTQKKESPVKATEPSQTDKEEKKASNPAAGKFSGKSGNTDGKADGSASGGVGTGVTGSAHGRTFISCDTPKTTLRFKTVVVVDVTVNAEGRVTAASARSGGDAAIRRECERAAKTARWSPKKGAGETRGTITFTITPK